MKDSTRTLLSLPTLPGRIPAEMAAELLGFTPDGIAVLIAAKWLRPLGRPRSGTQKFFASVDVRRLQEDRDWLSKATDLLAEHHATRNARARRRRRDTAAPGQAIPMNSGERHHG